MMTIEDIKTHIPVEVRRLNNLANAVRMHRVMISKHYGIKK